jgi:hypothetical protein
MFTFGYLVYLAVTFEAPEGTTTVVIQPPALRPAVEEISEPFRPSLPQTRIQPEPEPAAPAAAVPLVEAPPVQIAASEPEIVIDDTSLAELPSLNDSDGFVLDSISALQNGLEAIRLLANDQLVRKFVVFVDNISRGEFPQTGLPYRSLTQEMPVENIDDNLFVMDDSAFKRFDQIVDTFVSIDTDSAIILYRSLSPLFQQAYGEIGFRNVNFDDTLRSAINNVLRTDNVEGPFQLVKPSVMFLYADASIENLQDVHKQLIRLGPDNTQKLKAKLRNFSSQL